MIYMNPEDILTKLNKFMETMVFSKEFAIKCKREMDRHTAPKMLSTLVDECQPEFEAFVSQLSRVCSSKSNIQSLIARTDDRIILCFYASYDIVKISLLSHESNQKWKISDNFPDFLEDLFIGYINDLGFLPKD